MAIPRFVFTSDNLPKLKARQLAKSFPFLKLSIAQETTAKALGYPSWYECIHKGTSGKLSLSDQDAGLSTRVDRYYHQANMLMNAGITAYEADYWVRAWGLTGQPTLSSKHAQPLYKVWDEALLQLHRGEINEQAFCEEFGDGGRSKYPEIDRPQRICQGVILGPLGKYPHYAVDPSIAARIPVYLREPSSTYHIEDARHVLAMFAPGFPVRNRKKNTPLFNRIHHEWHFGEKHPEESDLCVPKLVALALKKPDEFMVISSRMMPTPDNNFSSSERALACLRGRDFAAFLNNKGVIDFSTVVWFQDAQSEESCFEFGRWLNGFDGPLSNLCLPIFQNGTKLTPTQPLYSYPFMTAPMSEDEYSMSIERPCLLPLDCDIDEDENSLIDGDDEHREDGDAEAQFQAELNRL